jgi:hypothetical protein
MLQGALLIVEKVAQRIVDRPHGDRDVPCRGAVRFGQPLQDLSYLDPRLRPVLFELGQALRGVDAALEMAGPSRGKIELAAH